MELYQYVIVRIPFNPSIMGCFSLGLCCGSKTSNKIHAQFMSCFFFALCGFDVFFRPQVFQDILSSKLLLDSVKDSLLVVGGEQGCDIWTNPFVGRVSGVLLDGSEIEIR